MTCSKNLAHTIAVASPATLYTVESVGLGVYTKKKYLPPATTAGPLIWPEARVFPSLLIS